MSGLDYYNARYYDPVMAQFLSADNVQGNVQGMDPYAYVAENPETATDPTGQALVIDGGIGNTIAQQHGNQVNHIPATPRPTPKLKPTSSPIGASCRSGGGKIEAGALNCGVVKTSRSSKQACDTSCQEETEAQQKAKDAAAHFQGWVDTINRITGNWLLGFLNIASLTLIFQALNGIASIASIYAKGFAEEANHWSLNQFDWVSVETQEGNMASAAAHETAITVVTALGAAAIALALDYIGGALMKYAEEGSPLYKIGNGIMGLINLGPVGATTIAATLWIASAVLEDQAGSYVAQQAQDVYNL